MTSIVVADTGPLNYLLLIDQIDLLPRLFETVYIPETVRAELSDEGAPEVVRTWIAAPTAWLRVEPTPLIATQALKLDRGEQAAIALAIELQADTLLIDDRAAAVVARARGFVVTGTLGILGRAAALGCVDLPVALARLTATNFRISRQLVEDLIAKYPAGR